MAGVCSRYSVRVQLRLSYAQADSALNLSEVKSGLEPIEMEAARTESRNALQVFGWERSSNKRRRIWDVPVAHDSTPTSNRHLKARL